MNRSLPSRFLKGMVAKVENMERFVKFRTIRMYLNADAGDVKKGQWQPNLNRSLGRVNLSLVRLFCFVN